MRYDLEECMKGAEFVCEQMRDHCSGFSVFGSTIYGTGEIKPDRSSDIDCMCLISDSSDIVHLDNILEKQTEGRSLFDRGHVDVLVIRGTMNNRSLSLHCVRPQTYKAISLAENPFVLEYKRLKDKVPSTSWKYAVYGFSSSETVCCRIMPLLQGHVLTFPNNSALSDGQYALTMFQRQILTSVEHRDEQHHMASCRETLQRRVRDEASQYNKDPFLLFGDRTQWWGPDWINTMRSRFGGTSYEQ